jgi:hypothetical protein
MGHLLDHAQVSAADQNVTPQIDALAVAGRR